MQKEDRIHGPVKVLLAHGHRVINKESDGNGYQDSNNLPIDEETEEVCRRYSETNFHVD